MIHYKLEKNLLIQLINCNNFVLLQVIPANYDLEVVLENLSIGYDPQTSISVANNGRIFCQFSFDSGEKYAMNELGLQNLDISFNGEYIF